MNWKIVLFGVLAVIHAQARAEGNAVATRLGLLGLGLEYSYSLSERLAFRGGVYGSSYSFDRAESGINYDFELNWESISLALDLHPVNGPFRISGGFLNSDNGLAA